ncbi:MAG: PAS domain-containing protein [Victivallales bacterium]|nr:PAS domain-containing protein [Victivallales bacterium]
MEVYFNKIESQCKLKRMSQKTLMDKLGKSRMTLWRWKREIQKMSETDVRKIANILNVPVEEISDLCEMSDIPVTEISNSVKSWIELVSNNSKVFDDKVLYIISRLQEMNKTFNSIMLFVNGILKTSDIAFYAKDKHLKYIIANSAFLKKISLSPHYSVLGKTDRDFFTVDESKENIKEDAEILKTLKPMKNKERFFPGTKKKYWGLVSKTPIFDSNGKILGIIAFIVDITEKRKKEEKRKLLEKSVNSLNSAVTISTVSDDKIIFVSDSFKKIFGSSTEQCNILTEKERITSIVYKDDRKTVFRHLLNKRYDKGTVQYRIIRHDNNKMRWIKESYSIFTYFEISCKISLFEDITEQVTKTKEEKFLNDHKEIIALKLKSCGVEPRIIKEATGIKLD